MRKPIGYWIKERCAEIALNKHSSAYFIASKNNWLNEFYAKII